MSVRLQNIENKLNISLKNQAAMFDYLIVMNFVMLFVLFIIFIQILGLKKKSGEKMRNVITFVLFVLIFVILLLYIVKDNN